MKVIQRNFRSAITKMKPQKAEPSSASDSTEEEHFLENLSENQVQTFKKVF